MITAIRILIIACLYSAAGLAISKNDPDHKCGKENCSIRVPSVSIIKLVANPQKYHGQRIRVTGLTSMEFEGTAIYLDESHYENMLTDNAIWLSLNSWGQAQSHCHLKYCLVEGTFNAYGSGHLNGWPGEIVDIYRIGRSYSRTEIQRMRMSSEK